MIGMIIDIEIDGPPTPKSRTICFFSQLESARIQRETGWFTSGLPFLTLATT